jgi:ABC-type polar amino acid transport system ATPase subunit
MAKDRGRGCIDRLYLTVNQKWEEPLNKARSEIVAIARTLLLRMRRMLLDKQTYALKLAA